MVAVAAADMDASQPPDYAAVVAAAERLAGAAIRTPVMTSRTADERLGANLFFKCENLQHVGAFKFRGAYNAIASLDAAQRARGVLAFSSGNHAQAVARAGTLLGVKTTILMPNDAPKMKADATAGYGGTVVLFDRYKDDRDALAAQMARDKGLTLIPPYDNRDVIAGQGTAAKELFEDVGPLDMLLVCLGGGGLLGGSALAAKALSPGCEVIGVEPEAGNDAQQSKQRGEIVRIETPRSIADGALTTHVGRLTFPLIRDLVTDIATVSDPMLIETMRFFAERMKMVVEPTGCLAASAALQGAVACAGKRVGVIISGGNVDLARFCALLTG